MDDLKIEDLKEYLKHIPEEKQIFTVFKLLRDCKDKKLESIIISELSKDINDMSKICFILGIKNLFKQSLLLENKEIKEKILVNYKKILKNAKQLAVEFNLYNSLQLCNLYTYLLWNGYFSINKKMTYQLDKRINIEGMYSYDIMNGIGACLNFSSMLTDFINEFDYSGATLVNSMSENSEIFYKPKIERNKLDLASKNQSINHHTSIFKSNMNHVFNLINENGKFYIYDSTNLALARLANHKQVDLVSGKGEAILKSYFSYVFNLYDKATDVLDLFHETDELNCPYTINDYMYEWEFCYELFQDEKKLMDDFYDEIKNNIVNVSELYKEVEKIKKY